MSRNVNRIFSLLGLLAMLYFTRWFVPSAGWLIYGGVTLFWWGFSHLMYRNLRN